MTDVAETHPSLRFGLKPVLDGLEEVAQTQPEAMTFNPVRLTEYGYAESYDPFGDLSVGTSLAFMAKVDEYLMKHKRIVIHPAELLKLREKFIISNLGIGVIAVFSEIVPLAHMRDAPDIELTPESAAEVTRNSYDFIQRILSAGGRVGSALAHIYIDSGSKEESGIGFEGTIRGGQLADPDRLARFELVPGEQPKVSAVGIDGWTEAWQAETAQLGMPNKVNCPAEIYKDPVSSEKFARRLFEIMVNHARAHIYPDYLPQAREVIERERSAGHLALSELLRDASR